MATDQFNALKNAYGVFRNDTQQQNMKTQLKTTIFSTKIPIQVDFLTESMISSGEVVKLVSKRASDHE